jgi:flagella basal body P-ring formation protein FlgA
MTPTMRLFTTAVVLLSISPTLAAQAPGASRDLRTAIAAAVAERLGGGADLEITVEMLDGDDAGTDHIGVSPAPGARIGQPARFVVTTSPGRSHSVLARVDVVAPHVVATRALPADAPLTADDVHLARGPLRDLTLQPLPTWEEVVAARPKRSVAQGEVLTRAALARPFAVRAGDTVTLTVRAGSVEVRGVGRAVSSGYVGDVIRILPPGRREPARGRVVAPAAVEILP